MHIEASEWPRPDDDELIAVPSPANLSAVLNLTATVSTSRRTPHMSPLLAMVICVTFLVLLRRSWPQLLRLTQSHLPLRRHLGGRGHYVSLSQSDG